MRVETQAVDAGELDVDVLGVPVTEDTDHSRFPEPCARLAALSDAGDVRSDVGAATIVHLSGELAARRLAAVGVGAEPDADAIRTAAAAVARAARRSAAASAGCSTRPSRSRPPTKRARGRGNLLRRIRPGRWKTGEQDKHEIERVVLTGAHDDGVGLAAERASQVSGWVDFARDLANAPPNELTPEELAKRTASAGADVEHLEVEALDRGQIESLGMGSFAAVAQGSAHEPRLIVMRHRPPGASSDVTLGLVGKAVTFDTGGISLKPALSMDSMKGDMAGGAAVIAATAAIAALAVPLIVTVVAATENMPGGNAFRPGDILRALNGKTIEITNTDAEGRLVLADALTYARAGRNAHRRRRDAHRRDGARARRPLRGRVRQRRRVARRAARGRGGVGRPPGPSLHPRYRRYVDSTSPT